MATTRQQVSPRVKQRQDVALRAAGGLRQFADLAELMALAVNDKEQADLTIRMANHLGGARELRSLIAYVQQALAELKTA